MKTLNVKGFIGFIAAAGLAIMMAACSGSVDSGKGGGIAVTLPSARGAMVFSAEKVASYTITVSGSGTEIEKTAKPGDQIVFEDLDAGRYTVEGRALDADGNMIASGSATAKVTGGETAAVALMLNFPYGLHNGSSILDSNYTLWNYTSSGAYVFKNFAAIPEESDLTSLTNNSDPYYSTISFAEDKSGNAYYMSLDYIIVEPSSRPSLYLVSDLSNQTDKEVSIANIDDPLYYDDVNDTLYVATFDSTNGLYIGKQANPAGSGYADETNLLMQSVSKNGITGVSNIFCYAVQGNNFYLAYQSSSDNTAHLLRGTLDFSDSSNVGVQVLADKDIKGLGFGSDAVSAVISDIVIMYDGTVYALVRQNANNYNYFDLIEIPTTDAGDARNVFSRGAVLKLEETSGGFEVAEKLGWTSSSRLLQQKGNTWDTVCQSDISDISAYIPEYENRNTAFYGPRRFVALKPKELAIVDCGVNIVLPDYDNGNKKTGNVFIHNRVVTVNLADFSMNVEKDFVTKMKPESDASVIKFANILISGIIGSSSSGYEPNQTEE